MLSNFTTHMNSLYRKWRQGEPTEQLPVLPGVPVIGHLTAFRKNAFAVLEKANTLGDVSRIDLLHTPVYFVKHPDLLSPLLDTQDLWLRGEGLQPMLGRNVLTTNGEEWRQSRTMAQPSFHPKAVERLAQDFTERASNTLLGWKHFVSREKPVDLAREAVALFANCAPPAFGLHLLPGESKAFPETIWRLQQWAFADLAGGKGRSRQVDKDMGMLDEIIRRSLTKPAPSGQWPTYLERIRQDHAIPRERLRDHLMLMLIASSDNPPNTFAFVIWLLMNHPEWEEKVRAEIKEVIGNETPTVESLEALPISSRVVQESLRLYPPVWMLARNSVQETELSGHRIPAGTLALIGTYFVHRHPAFWTSPERFNPDRFLPEQEEKRHRLAYLPFGAGPRHCIGSRLALLEIRLFLVLFLQRFRARATFFGQLPLQGLFALRSTIGVPCKLEETKPE